MNFAFDNDDDDDEYMIDCPNCGNSMFDESPRCPSCGHYLTNADRGTQFPPWIKWVVAVTIMLMLLPFLLVLWKSLVQK